MANKEGLVANLPANTATKADAGIVLGKVIELSRTTPQIKGVQFFTGPLEGQIHLSLELRSPVFNILGQIDDLHKVENVELKTGETSNLTLSYNVIDAEEFGAPPSEMFVGQDLHSVWKPKS